jgi:hypothetical protein
MTTRIDLFAPSDPLPSEQEATNIALDILQLADGLSQACPGRRLSIEPELVHLIAWRAAYRGQGVQLLSCVQRAIEMGCRDRADDDAAAGSAGGQSAASINGE